MIFLNVHMNIKSVRGRLREQEQDQHYGTRLRSQHRTTLIWVVPRAGSLDTTHFAIYISAQ
jgi:hypothetical protein